MKGLKIRTMPDPIMVETINAMGGMGVSMGLGELYSALQQGVLDGISTSSQLLTSLKIYEVAKFYAPMNMHYTPAQILVNVKFWNTLSAEHQKVIQESMKKWEKGNDAYFLDPAKQTSNDFIFSVMKGKGVEITPVDTAPFKKMTASVVKKYRTQIGADYVDQVLKFTGYKLE